MQTYFYNQEVKATIQINNVIIEQVKELKYLGTSLDATRN